MDCGSFVEQAILMHYANDRTLLDLDDSTNRANIYISALMVINASDINSLSSFEDNTVVCTSYTATLAPLSMSDKERPNEA
jgi:ABC-type phosphate/phosphonate transport system substrate-binding protein